MRQYVLTAFTTVCFDIRGLVLFVPRLRNPFYILLYTVSLTALQWQLATVDMCT